MNESSFLNYELLELSEVTLEVILITTQLQINCYSLIFYLILIGLIFIYLG